MITIITPTHDPLYLGELAESIQAQTSTDWEWRILVNGTVTVPQVEKIVQALPRDKIIIMDATNGISGVGALKKQLCDSARGDIILEVDHDDLLMPTALADVQEAFDLNPDICFVYSNCSYITKGWEVYQFGAGYQWEYRPFSYKGHDLQEIRSPAPVPQELSYIWYAPDHLRAWRRKDYNEIGGHDPELVICDDHDMVLRTYLHGKMLHLDKCLYIYRVHNNNTWLDRNAKIQQGTQLLFDNYIEKIACKWTDDIGLKKIDLCGGIAKPEGYISLDLSTSADIVCDLNERWNLQNNSVGVLRAFDALEHLKDPIHVMNEAYRVLAHGGFFLIMVPSTDGRGAFQDPTHISYWNENSFWYYTQVKYNKYLGDKCPVHFQLRKLETVFPSQYHRDHNIPYVWVVLIAIKDKPFHGAREI